MKEYSKISNVFSFNPDYKSILGFNPKVIPLKDIIWSGSEKVDGSSTRIYWDGHKISVAGRTDNSQFQGDSESYLKELFIDNKNMEYLFEQVFEDKETIIFGETYGPKIQTSGGFYGNKPQFIVFDINIDGFDLTRENIDDVAEKLGLKSVPVIFEGTIEQTVDFVKQHHMSTISNKHEMEGIILQPKDIQIRYKCKYRDMVKAGLVHNE